METEEKQTDSLDEISKSLRIMEVVETELEQQRKESILCLMVFLCAMSVWVLLVALWETLGRPIRPQLMTVGVELIAAVMLVCVLKFTRLDVRKMGITKKNLKPSLVRAGVISAITIAVMLAVKLVMRQEGQPLVNWELFKISYALTSVLQEFLARGFLVTTLIRIVSSEKKNLIVIVASSLMFTTLHLYYGLFYMLGAGLLSVLLGWCYLKDENIWGVSIIHFVFGTVGTILELV